MKISDFKIKETYLLFLIVIGLTSLAVYSTVALFTSSHVIEDVVNFSTDLSTENSIIEYEIITIGSGETKIIELTVNNNYSSDLYYGAWYEIVSPSDIDDIDIGIYSDKDSTSSSGKINSGDSITLLVGISNDREEDAIINIGTIGNVDSNLNLNDTRKIIPIGWSEAILVTDEYLEANTTITTGQIKLEYTTPEMTEIELTPGTYKLEVWGAQGGSYNATYVGGKGGYSYGTLTLTEATPAYIYVGGQPETNTNNRVVVKGGFNGGGNGYNRYYGDVYTYGQGGGGASDIRIGQDSLYARIIVAGGGSGSTNRTSGYYGGGETSGGGVTNYEATSTMAGMNGLFGSGASATTSGSNYKYGSAGGGGGWYGGGSTNTYSDTTNYDTYSGGGSGYVYTSTTTPDYPQGYPLNENHFLSNADTKGGNEQFVDFNGSTVTGHSGNGAVRISGTGQIISYSIPRVLGLDPLYVLKGSTADVNDGISIKCVNGENDCRLLSIDSPDISSLSLGTHTIYYTIKDANNKKYIYAREVIVTETLSSTMVLKKLGLKSTNIIPNLSATSCSSGCGENSVGVFETIDDLGKTYYFRGNVTNNYVRFGKNSSGVDMYWRIIRINGDGSIRMIYDGTSAHENGTADTDGYVTTLQFNTSNTDNAYLGYMYGTVGSSSYSATHANNKSSAIKTYNENWYKENIVNTGFSQYVVDAIYCNDRKISSKDSTLTGNGSGTQPTAYMPMERLYTVRPAIPSLICENTNDKFTIINSNIANTNGKLTYPIGLITADEIAFAGGRYATVNQSYYLYNGSYSYWTMSPHHLLVLGSAKTPYPYQMVGNSDGKILMTAVNGSDVVVRPVISITPTAIKYGNGTISEPFRINE